MNILEDRSTLPMSVLKWKFILLKFATNQKYSYFLVNNWKQSNCMTTAISKKYIFQHLKHVFFNKINWLNFSIHFSKISLLYIRFLIKIKNLQNNLLIKFQNRLYWSWQNSENSSISNWIHIIMVSAEFLHCDFLNKHKCLQTDLTSYKHRIWWQDGGGL